MSRVGFLDLIGLAVTFAFAVPIGLFGVWQFLDGELLLGVFGIGTAVLMIAINEVLVTPDDLPTAVAKRTVGYLTVEEPDPDSTDEERD